VRLARTVAVASLVGAATLAASSGVAWLVAVVAIVLAVVAYASGILDTRQALRDALRPDRR